MLAPGTYCLRCRTADPLSADATGRTVYVCGRCGAQEERALVVDSAIRTAETPRGMKHWTAGALIERNDTFLVMRKRQWPYLWDVIAGHLGPDEDPAVAAAREVAEETGLTLRGPHLVFHGEIYPDPCRRGATLHEWSLYRGPADGALRPDDREVAELRWATAHELAELPFVRPAYVLFDTIRLWEEVPVRQKSTS